MPDMILTECAQPHDGLERLPRRRNADPAGKAGSVHRRHVDRAAVSRKAPGSGLPITPKELIQ